MSTDLHTLSGAYAVDALSPEEAEEFRKHLDGCPACREEVRELREAAARMGASEAVTPPAHLKANIMVAADRLPQLPPKVRHIGTAKPSRWTPRILGAAAAVVLIVAAGIGISQLPQDDDNLRAAPVAQVFDAPDAATVTVQTSNGGELTVATSEERGEMAVDTDELPPLTDDQVYQLWAIAGDDPVSAGVLEDVDKGAAMELPAAGTQVAITIEPAGGSEQPTTEPIIVVDPSAV